MKITREFLSERRKILEDMEKNFRQTNNASASSVNDGGVSNMSSAPNAEVNEAMNNQQGVGGMNQIGNMLSMMNGLKGGNMDMGSLMSSMGGGGLNPEMLNMVKMLQGMKGGKSSKISKKKESKTDYKILEE